MLCTMCSIDKETGLIDRLTPTFVEGNKQFSFDFDKEGFSSTVGPPTHE